MYGLQTLYTDFITTGLQDSQTLHENQHNNRRKSTICLHTQCRHGIFPSIQELQRNRSVLILLLLFKLLLLFGVIWGSWSTLTHTFLINNCIHTNRNHFVAQNLRWLSITQRDFTLNTLRQSSSRKSSMIVIQWPAHTWRSCRLVRERY